MTIRVAGAVNRRILTEPWYDYTLPGTGRFDVAGIPPGFSILAGKAWLRSSVTATSDAVFLFSNADLTLTNYLYGQVVGGSSAPSATSGDEPRIGGCAAASSPANYFTPVVFEISNYAGSGSKIYQVSSYQRRDATVILVVTGVVSWESVSAINRLTLQPDGYATDTFVAGSRLQIWLLP